MRIVVLGGLSFVALVSNSSAAIPPTIPTQPLSQAAMIGSNVTFSVSASGTAPLYFQWRFNGVELDARTNSSLTLLQLKPSNEGTYSVVVTNSAGAVTSQVARLQFVSGFTRVADAALGQSGRPLGAAWADFNNDGWVDLFIASDSYLIYTNKGDGTFAPLTNRILAGESSGGRIGAGWADFDNDGHLDLAVAGNSGGPLYLYRNLGDGQQFARIATNIFNGPGMQMFTPAWGDYDNDGFVDMFVAVSPSGGSGNDLLFRNNGDGTFSKITNSVVVQDGRLSQSAIWGDFDNDGDLDLYTTEPNSPRNMLYRNDGGGAFTIVTNGPIAADNGNVSGGCVWADFDNDGDLDLFSTGFSGNAFLYRNEGGGIFSKITDSIVVLDGASAGCTALDFDNDGWLDLVSPGPKNILYHNNRDGTFTKVTTGDVVAHPVVSWGNNSFAVADVNRDGFEDLLWVDYNANSQLYRNDGNSNHWLTVRCDGRMSNRAGIGVKVRVKATIGGRTLWQLREISGGGLVFAQNEPVAHFGLGDATNAELVRVEWTSGLAQEFVDVAAKQFLAVTEPELHITPGDQFVPAGTNVNFRAITTLAPPLEYQWKLNGADLTAETNATLAISNVQTAHSGRYSVRIRESGSGFAFEARPVTLAGAVVFTEQPQVQNVRQGSNATLRVSATGFAPLNYQWRLNGTNIVAATNALLTVTNVQLADEGAYSVILSNSYGQFTSAAADVIVLIRPRIVLQPLSQSIVAGGSVTLSASAEGHPPPLVFRWRKAGAVVTNDPVNEGISFFTITNLRATASTNQFYYSVVVTNLAGNSVLSSNVVITVLPDTDSDGLPDEWESANGLDATNASDASLDRDGDGMSNLREYQTGTDPNDPGSLLKLECAMVNGSVSIRFVAISNKTYAIESRTLLNEGIWKRVADVPATPTNRIVEINDNIQAQRFCRVVSPRRP